MVCQSSPDMTDMTVPLGSGSRGPSILRPDTDPQGRSGIWIFWIFGLETENRPPAFLEKVEQPKMVGKIWV